MKIHALPFLLFRQWHDARSHSPSAEPRVLSLPADGVLRLDRSSRVKGVAVRSGTVWLTGTPAKGDVILRPGDRCRFDGGWPFVLQAIGDAEMVLLHD